MHSSRFRELSNVQTISLHLPTKNSTSSVFKTPSITEVKITHNYFKIPN